MVLIIVKYCNKNFRIMYYFSDMSFYEQMIGPKVIETSSSWKRLPIIYLLNSAKLGRIVKDGKKKSYKQKN